MATATLIAEVQTGTVTRAGTEHGVFNQVKREGEGRWPAVYTLIDGVPAHSTIFHTRRAALKDTGCAGEFVRKGGKL